MVAFNHPNLLVFIIVLNAFIFSMFFVLPPDVVASFNNVKTPVYSNQSDFIDYDNSTTWNETLSQLESTTFTGWDSVKAYLSFMFGGIITFSGMPIYLSLPILVGLWALNLVLIIGLLSYIRELVGFT